MTEPERIADGLSEAQQRAIMGCIFLAGSWGLTTEYEDHPDIVDGLSEDIADPVSGELTPLGLAVRAILLKGTLND